jgi:tetratricopeptide (TPR) repeat protein
MFRNLIIATALLLSWAVSPCSAQMLIMKDGTQLGTEAFKVEGGKLYKLVRVGENTAQSLLPMASIAKMDWPDVEELAEANNLLAAGKNAEAVAVLKKGKEFFEPFEKIEGSRYTEVYLAYVDALSQSGAFEDTMRAIPGLRLQKLNAEQQLKLKIIQLNMDRQTSSNPKSIVAQAEVIRSETDDSAVSASLWILIGDVYARAKDWEQALMAYLHVSVFFGTQVQKVPDAELNAARCLKEMRRFEDAAGFYTRLEETYPGSGVAATATKEKAGIAGLKNDEAGQAPPAKAGDKPEETAKAAEGTTPSADAAKPAEPAPAAQK